MSTSEDLKNKYVRHISTSCCRFVDATLDCSQVCGVTQQQNNYSPPVSKSKMGSFQFPRPQVMIGDDYMGDIHGYTRIY
jgi:hypothetical protein